jgi:dihydroneopterin aldolase / 2-amino-4-hydroxy-6-hydroxymethyldihydropteridine diphosphokinase / dihydropteroate synthase
MIPDFIHPVLKKTIRALLKDIMRSRLPGDASMRKVIPFPRYPLSVPPSSHETISVPVTSNYWKYLSPSSESSPSTSSKQKTYLMATLNVTPDSFSDGSMHNSLPAAISYATASVAAGADIIDIGGYSTRPGAIYVSLEEEISRVVPIIEALRDVKQPNAKLRDVLISVDTFRADVAKAAVLAGANCINDVYAFTGPEYPLTEASAKHLLSMRQVARDLAVPVVLMHSRGDAGANKDYGAYGECAGAVLEGIRVELGDKVDTIVKGRGGVRRWLVIVDPGVGFSKDVDANLEVLRHAKSIIAESRLGEAGGMRRNPLAGYPQLVGPSRKSFLGVILGQPDEEGGYEGRETAPRERGWGTAATVACAVQQGALAVRVHDVLEMGDIVRVASALWGRR